MSLILLGGYLAFAFTAAAWRLARGDGSSAAVTGYAVMLGILVAMSRRSGRTVEGITGWAPLLALPALYLSVPATAVRSGYLDAMVQEWDRALFGTDPARTLAAAFPSPVLSELLHAAYLSYYAIIYGPPLLMYARGAIREFDGAVLSFTIAMVGCLALFCFIPVSGPRYEWLAPQGIPEGFFRRLSVAVLEGGSARGTAFPSSHLAIALSLSLSSFAFRRWLGMLTLGLTLLLGVGAVYGGFHYATDMIAGAGVGVSAWAASRLMTRSAVAAPA